MSYLEKNELINPQNLSTKYGLAAGGLMALLLLAFQIAGQDWAPYLKLTKYAILLVVLALAFNNVRKSLRRVFIDGFPIGLKLSAIAGLTLVLFTLILFFLAPDLAYSKYGLEPTNLQQAILISAILFFETLVFGGIITFIILQYLKGDIVT